MGLFKKKQRNIEDIVNVVILEQSQNYSRGKAKAGLAFGDSLLNPDVIFMDGELQPAGCTYTFSVTYRGGDKEIVKAVSGTALCDSLLQIAMDGGNDTLPAGESPKATPEKAPELKKNQLSQGVYKVGQDVPAGTYDFHHVWGNGGLQVYRSEKTTLGNCEITEWIGDKQEYEKPDCLNVKCEEGWYIHVTGNLIVEISKSKKVEIDL